MIYLLSTFSIDALSIVSICLSMSSLALSIVTSGPQTTSKNVAVFLTLSFGMIHKLLAFSMFAVSFPRAMIVLCAILDVINFFSYAALIRIDDRESILQILTLRSASQDCCLQHFLLRLIFVSISFIPLLLLPLFAFQKKHLEDTTGRIITVVHVCLMTCVSIGVGLYATLYPLTPFEPYASFLMWHIITSVLYVCSLLWCSIKGISIAEEI